MDTNKCNFSQTVETPLSSNEVYILGFVGETKIANKILDDKADIPNITDNKTAQLQLDIISC